MSEPKHVSARNTRLHQTLLLSAFLVLACALIFTISMSPGQKVMMVLVAAIAWFGGLVSMLIGQEVGREVREHLEEED